MAESFSNYSFRKADTFAEFLQNHVDHVRRSQYGEDFQWSTLDPYDPTAKRHYWDATGEPRFIYVDAHGGLGLWTNDQGQRCMASSVMAYRLLDRIGVPYVSLVYEIKESRYTNLKSSLAFGRWPIHVYNQDNRFIGEHLQQLQQQTAMRPETPGVIYFDNNGCASVSQIMNVTSCCELDVLIHTSATGYKRRAGKEGEMNEDLKVLDHLSEFNRRYWYISNPDHSPDNKQHFYFLHGSNVHPETIAANLHAIDSGAGKRAQEVALYTNAMRADNWDGFDIPDRLPPADSEPVEDTSRELVADVPNQPIRLSTAEVVEVEEIVESTRAAVNNIFDDILDSSPDE